MSGRGLDVDSLARQWSDHVAASVERQVQHGLAFRSATLRSGLAPSMSTLATASADLIRDMATSLSMLAELANTMATEVPDKPADP